MNRLKLFILLVFYSAIVLSGRAQDLSSLANQFLQTLSEKERSATQFILDDPERFNWHFVPLERKGITFHKMRPEQKSAAMALLRASLGEQGYAKTTGIIQLENVLIILEQRKPEDPFRDPLNYHFSIFGQPSPDKAWGWRFEGHHISFNFASTKGNIVSSTPSFLGSNPGIVPIGAEKGKMILKKESDLGFSLLESMSPQQMKNTVFSDSALKEIISFDKRKAEPLTPAGISYPDLNEKQKSMFLELLDVYVRNYAFDFSDRLMKKIKNAGIEKLSFAWAGSKKPGAAHYYRIQGPMLVIEFDNTQNNANHIHTTVRDLTNDFAEDILKEHYQSEHH